MIKWFNVKEKIGMISLYQNYIVLNTTSMYPFDSAYRVQVGVDDKQQIIIKPITKEVVESGIFDKYSLIKIEMRKSFARISSVALLTSISDSLNLKLSKTPIQFETRWDGVDNYLVANTQKKERK